MLDWEVLHSMGVDRWGARGTRPPTFQLEMSSHLFSSYNKFKGIHCETDHSHLL